MKKPVTNILFLIAFICQSIAVVAQPSSFEKQLFALPDVIFHTIDTPAGYKAAYELSVKQPIDHDNPAKGHFYQRVFLSHKGYNLPTVMVTEGYQRSANRISEVADYLDGNQIMVEHRYFGESKPEKMDWQYLNLKQVTADLHKINQLFRQIYKGKWVSTGISKSGQTTIFYRYFYPNDVDVSIPYVAPLNLAYEDKRIYDFLENVGTAECRKDIKDLQIRLLKDRKEVLPLLKWFAKGKGYTFNYMSLEEAFEYAVLEYPFSFWQLGHNCNTIPNEDAPLDEILEDFINVVGLYLYADEGVEVYGPHYYQAVSEMGYYGFDTKPFRKHLKVLPKRPHAAFAPDHLQPEFDDTLIKKVAKWLAKEGNEFIYIYGGIDTWTATQVPESDKVDALWIVMDGKSHSNARIKNMNDSEKQKLKAALDRWLLMD